MGVLIQSSYKGDLREGSRKSICMPVWVWLIQNEPGKQAPSNKVNWTLGFLVDISPQNTGANRSLNHHHVFSNSGSFSRRDFLVLCDGTMAYSENC